MRKVLLLQAIMLYLLPYIILGQENTGINISFEEMEIENLPGIHSYAYGNWDNKQIIIGGRLDGIHARQPFASFPEDLNNRDIIILDIANNNTKKIPVSIFDISVSEQLQSTNMEFYQDANYLILIGGYSFAHSKDEHITHPGMILIDLEKLLEAGQNETTLKQAIKYIHDERFAVTGGQLGKIDDTYFLVGGHRFDGAYNPMNHPTFVQTYTNGLAKFKINIQTDTVVIDNYEKINDPLHLHRRDFNMSPTVFENGEKGYILYSGVFQINQDLPFLYPVEIRKNGHEAIPSFNQYLSNYHSAKINFIDENGYNTIFLGGISQYYFEDKILVNDELVPFVKSISMVRRDKNSNYKEYLFTNKMPDYLGASAEFVSATNEEIISLEEWDGHKKMIGYLVGGIRADIEHPFQMNSTQSQSNASSKILKVYLEKTSNSLPVIAQKEKPTITFLTNPVNKMKAIMSVEYPFEANADIYISDTMGRLINTYTGVKINKGETQIELNLTATRNGIYNVLLVANSSSFAVARLMIP